jgi:hypothetical protein
MSPKGGTAESEVNLAPAAADEFPDISGYTGCVAEIEVASSNEDDDELRVWIGQFLAPEDHVRHRRGLGRAWGDGDLSACIQRTLYAGERIGGEPAKRDVNV